MSALAYLDALRLPHTDRDVVTLVARPGSQVAHVYVGPKTPSGFVPRRSRPVCRAHTRRLSVLETGVRVVDLGGRRVCVRCSARLSADALRAEQRLVSRDDFLSAYSHLTMRDLVNAIQLATSVAETHRVGYLAGLLFDPPPVRITADTDPERVALFYLHQRILDARRHWVAVERTQDERDAAAAQRAAEADKNARVFETRRRDKRAARLKERQLNGEYIAPWERPA